MRQIIVFALLFSNFPSFSQVNRDTVEIDPRQYVTIQYKKNPVKSKLDTIWEWETRKNVPSQKTYSLDVNGDIKIMFDKSGMSANKNMEGMVSLEAEISGSEGVRKIEVSPYSEVGVERQTVGVESEPPGDLATRFLNMILELRDYKTVSNLIINFDTYVFDSALFERSFINPHQFDDLERFLDSVPADQLNRQFSRDDAESIRQDIVLLRQSILDKREQYSDQDSYFASVNNDLQTFLDPTKARPTYRSMKILFKTFKKTVTNANAQVKNTIITYKPRTIFTAIQEMKAKAKVVIRYLNSFSEAGDDARRAFFSFIKKDYVSYQDMLNNIVSSELEVSKVNLVETDFEDPQKIAPFRIHILRLNNLLTQLSSIRDSKIEQIADRIYQSKHPGTGFIDLADSVSGKTQTYDLLARDSSIIRFRDSLLFRTLVQNYDTIVSILAYEAGNIIYRRLVYATIDLGKSGAREGEVLNVYLTWILKNRDSLRNPPRLTIGKYRLREAGWKGSGDYG